MTVGLLRHNRVNLPFLKGMVLLSQVLDWFRDYGDASVEEVVPDLSRNEMFAIPVP